MWIEKIQIKNFGKFYDKTIEFTPNINVIYGANESGKTTIHTFLLGMLFGIEKSRGRSAKDDVYQNYEPWNSSSFYVGNAILNVSDKRFLIERNFYYKDKTTKLRSLCDGEELSVECGDLEMLLGGMTQKTYENTFCIKQAGFLADDSLAKALENYMADVSNSGGGSVRLSAALEELKKQKRQLEKEFNQLQAVREEKILRLQTEAELLQGDIAFQKRNEWMEQEISSVGEGESLLPEDNGEKKSGKLRFLSFSGIGLLFFGMVLCLFRGMFETILGSLLMFSGVAVLIGAFLQKRLEQSKRGEVSLQESHPEIVKGIEQVKEQWLEKENRYLNVTEQLRELHHKSEKEAELEEDIEAVVIAMQTLEQISANIYEEISDTLHEKVSGNLSFLTNGKYDSILLDEDLHMFIVEDGKKIPVSKLSRGTLEQAYLAIRMAVGSILSSEETMPVLFDETFSSYDDERLLRALNFLEKYSGQVLLFSCQKRELEALDQLGISYHRIDL